MIQQILKLSQGNPGATEFLIKLNKTTTMSNIKMNNFKKLMKIIEVPKSRNIITEYDFWEAVNFMKAAYRMNTANASRLFYQLLEID